MMKTALLQAARSATIRRVHAADVLIVTSVQDGRRARNRRFGAAAPGELVVVAALGEFEPGVDAMRSRLLQAIRQPARFDLIVLQPLIDSLSLAAAMAMVRALAERLAGKGWLVLGTGGGFSDGELLAVAAASGVSLICALPGPIGMMVLARE